MKVMFWGGDLISVVIGISKGKDSFCFRRRIALGVNHVLDEE